MTNPATPNSKSQAGPRPPANRVQVIGPLPSINRLAITLVNLLREFTFGHARQLDLVLSANLARSMPTGGSAPRVWGAGVRRHRLPGAPVCGHAKQGASYGHSKNRRQPDPSPRFSALVTTIDTDTAAPVVTGIRLRLRQKEQPA